MSEREELMKLCEHKKIAPSNSLARTGAIRVGIHKYSALILTYFFGIEKTEMEE